MEVMQKMLKVILMCIVCSGATSAYTATINGSMAVIGGMDTGGLNLANVTDISLTALFGADTGVGDFLNVTTSSTGTSSTTLGDALSLNAFVSVDNFIQIENWRFDLSTLNSIDQRIDLLTLKGTGLLTDMDGVLDSTAAVWELTTRSANSYGITVTAVPVPAAVWLFGSGLLGLAGIARRKA